MKVLLDENLPHDLRHFLPGHEVFTVAYMKWDSIENGELLRTAAAEGFDVMLTADAGVEYQQYQQALPLSVVVMRCKSNRLDDLRPLLPAVLSALASLTPKTLARLEAE